jgi:hypothetical protein
MKRSDIVALVAYVTQLVPAQNFDEYTALAWHDVLGDLPATLEQAKEATARVAKKQQWIYPSVIRGELMAIMPPRQHTGPAAILASPPSPREDRIERNARGAALAKAAVKPFPGAVREDAPEVPENLRKAREVAAAYKAGNAYRDRNLKLGAAGGQLMNQLSKQRDSLSRSRKE